MLRSCLLLTASAFFVLSAAAPAQDSEFVSHYKGTPYEAGGQAIPGRVQCAYYDRGGQGIAYYDTTAKNLGSGTLNPADGTPLNQFRMDEAVDTSYTKYHDQIDDNPYNLVKPPLNQLYVGWTEPGEWFNITVKTRRAGVYKADLLYTSNRGGIISFDVNGFPASGPVNILSTYNSADPIAWRQWHHWNMQRNLLRLELPAGISVLTIHILTQGNMNLAYFDFKEVK